MGRGIAGWVLAACVGVSACALTEEGRTLNAGDRLYEDGDLEGALERYRRVLDRDPGNARALYSASVVHYSRADYVRALELIDRAIDAERRAQWILQRGHTRIRLGDLDGAIADYETVIELDPSLTEAVFSIGIAYYNAREYERAREWLVRYLEREPGAENRRQVEELIRSLREWS